MVYQMIEPSSVDDQFSEACVGPISSTPTTGFVGAASCLTPGGRAARTPREAAADAQMVFSCVGNDDDLRSVMLGADGAFAGLGKDAIVFDDTTASARVARELYAEARGRGLHFIDAGRRCDASIG